MTTRQSSSLFTYINSDPNPDANPTLWEHRLRLRRPVSQNPFEPDDSVPHSHYGQGVMDSPVVGPVRRPSSRYEDDDRMVDENIKLESVVSVKKNLDRQWGDEIPGWLNLFYDLAWTATFSSLTSNAQFRTPWDSVSYVAFFTTAWWLWVSQVFYNVEFYTDDWFHLLFIFLQLVTFGALSATTRGFDVTNYILHSPGSDDLETYNVETISPDRYGAERLTKISIRVIMISISISRALLLIQHLRVAIYAKLTSTSKRLPLRLLIVPASLVISATLFFVAFRITMSGYGRTPEGAKTRIILWGVALLVEIIAHIVRFGLEIGEAQGLKLRSHSSIAGRLTDITTIILGEGLNAIAGTFYAIQKAPGFSGPTGTGIVCCAIIVFLVTYLYFNGAAPLKSVRRRAAWVMMHLPWLLSVILLLEGVKNQLVLQSFIRSTDYVQDKIINTLADSGNTTMAQLNATMRPILLQGGMSYDDEYGSLMRMVDANITANPRAGNMTQDELDGIYYDHVAVWILRLEMKGMLNMYITFMENDSIPETTQQNIQKYLNDYQYTLEDSYHLGVNGDIPSFFQSINELVKPSIDNGRYIMAMCGVTLVTLASLNLIQSWPRDRFHWASILSRYTMGIIMMLLLMLNIGKSQKYIESIDTPESHRSGVLRWIDAGWVLPTLALAYAIQFMIDTILVYLAVRTSRIRFQPVSQTDRV